MANIAPPKAVKSRKGAPPTMTQTVGNLDKPEPAATVNMNFKVPPDFRREFKTYAAQHGISMLDLLQEGFRLIKAQRG
jgi:hypothetical protein